MILIILIVQASMIQISSEVMSKYFKELWILYWIKLHVLDSLQFCNALWFQNQEESIKVLFNWWAKWFKFSLCLIQIATVLDLNFKFFSLILVGSNMKILKNTIQNLLKRNLINLHKTQIENKLLTIKISLLNKIMNLHLKTWLFNLKKVFLNKSNKINPWIQLILQKKL